jgi:hypothetical protein
MMSQLRDEPSIAVPASRETQPIRDPPVGNTGIGKSEFIRVADARDLDLGLHRTSARAIAFDGFQGGWPPWRATPARVFM